jgi:hypothetical protein
VARTTYGFTAPKLDEDELDRDEPDSEELKSDEFEGELGGGGGWLCLILTHLVE